jgi:hypothetical protein
MKIDNIEIESRGRIFFGNVMVLDRSCVIWIGMSGEVPCFSSLVTAMETRYDPMPLTSTLMSTGGFSMSNGIAQRLSKRFHIQVFLSFNIPEGYDSDIPAIELRLVETLCKHFSDHRDDLSA